MANRPSLLSRVLSPIVQLRDGESTTALLMFLYSFLAMTSYNIVKPITRSQFINSLGADNLPWVQFGAGMLIGVLMQGYSRVMAMVPRRWTVPVTQAGLVSLLVIFWVLFTQAKAEWVSVAFYVLGLIFGLLTISQFWTIANDIYDARQAKRLFGLRRAHGDDGDGGVSPHPFLDANGLFDGVFVERINGRGHAFTLQRSGFGIDLDVGGGGRLFDADDDMHNGFLSNDS